MADGSTGNGAESNNYSIDKIDSYLLFVREQIEYHESAAAKNKMYRGILFGLQAVLSFAVTLIGIFIAKGVSEDSVFTYIVGCVGVLLSAIASLQNAGRYNEKWLHHRHTSEMLKRELRLYDVQSADYLNLNKEEKFHHFVSKIEYLVNQEHQDWKVMIKERKKNEPIK